MKFFSVNPLHCEELPVQLSKGLLKTLFLSLSKGVCLTVCYARLQFKRSYKTLGGKKPQPSSCKIATENTVSRGVNRFAFNRCCVLFHVFLA